MGDAYLLPAIAAVVLGGTLILGGRGSYLGTVAGAILIALLQSILSVAQMPEAGRQIILRRDDRVDAAVVWTQQAGGVGITIAHLRV
jgi:ABC-type xylose transport system permease subunit